MSDIVKLAEKIATEAHSGQTRRDGKTPYITHPLAVRDIVLGWLDEYINSSGTGKTYLSAGLYFKFQQALQYFEYQELKELLAIISIYHDCPEDSYDKGFTADYLISKLKEQQEVRHGKSFFVSLKNALIALTHDKSESYLSYIVHIKYDVFATLVKIGDIAHNISTRNGSNTAGEIKKDKLAIEKYQLAEYILKN